MYTGGKSEAHLNPVMTFANCFYRKFPWRKFTIYALTKVMGAFWTAAVVYATNKFAIVACGGGSDIRSAWLRQPLEVGHLCTYPASFMTRTGQFFSEFIASPILMFLI